MGRTGRKERDLMISWRLHVIQRTDLGQVTSFLMLQFVYLYWGYGKPTWENGDICASVKYFLCYYYSWWESSLAKVLMPNRYIIYWYSGKIIIFIFHKCEGLLKAIVKLIIENLFNLMLYKLRKRTKKLLNYQIK